MGRKRSGSPPDGPEAVRLAARCQHIRRWTIPRADYPAGREGYRRWRTDLARFRAKRGPEQRGRSPS